MALPALKSAPIPLVEVKIVIKISLSQLLHNVKFNLLFALVFQLSLVADFDSKLSNPVIGFVVKINWFI